MVKVVESQDVIWAGSFVSSVASTQLKLRFVPTHVQVVSASGYNNAALDESMYIVRAPWVEGGDLAVISQPIVYDSTTNVGVENDVFPASGGKFVITGSVLNNSISIAKYNILGGGLATGTFALTLRFTREI